MNENRETIVQSNIYEDIYKLCLHIATQQTHILDILKAEFPEFYDRERKTLVNNTRTLNKSTQKIKEESNGEITGFVRPIIQVQAQEKSRLEKILEGKDLFNKLSKQLVGFSDGSEELKDIVQDALVKIYEKRHEYEQKEGGSMNSWISTVARNSALDYVRKKKRTTDIEKINEFTELHSEIEELGIEGKIDNVKSKEFFRKINSLMQQELNSYEKNLLLGLAKGKKYKELALELDKPEGTIMADIFKARQKMRPYLQMLKKELEN